MSDEIKLTRDGDYADEITATIPRELLDDSLTDDSGGRAACLLFLTGPRMGQCVALDDRAREVGRADQADIVIKDDGVSRRHARIYLANRDEKAQGQVGSLYGERDAFIQDLDSSNGVYVNGKRIRKDEQLFQGDKITLGTETVLRFTYQDQIDQQFQQHLLDLAINDALTGTRNRAYFDQQLGAEFDYASRHDSVLALIIFDIDHFKQVNNAHGHVAGDAVLSKLGERLIEAVREEDFLARFGGEEFAMICRGLSLDQGFRAAERLRRIIAQAPFECHGIQVDLTVSVGVASYPEVGAATANDLLGAADQALYRAKTTGRNQTFVAATNAC